ncbi:hypothetical protein HRG_005236 [Hirsutella rhossiliensis]|uniref:Uncharacterized protein n=1 Tax=Hirsutella rhossiliensis TaxID=111463 RepID=A0A9P8MYP9_9HYPO|nr:uncharacterized protein HRG_05236 [Hirsutella rhossiliensis]KAH0962726.1 hypothetical protein HRG_05236 [Hirsutella rhossiliensis]
MPFSESTFSRLVDRFYVHGSIARVINRSTNCIFSGRLFSWGNPPIQSYVYNCRSTASWSGDLALSATFFPESLATYAVMFGCDKEQTEEVIARLCNADDPVFHPMVLPTIFAEMERNRQIALVREITTSLAERVYNTGVGTDDTCHEQSRDGFSAPASPQHLRPIGDVIFLWTETGHLRDGLNAFKRQMEKMIEHLDELAVALFQPEGGTNAQTAGTTCDVERQKLCLKDSGGRIKMRLRELVDEYDEYILRCTTVMDGMNLATQLQISKSNLAVASLTRKDGKLMKSIAVLTMLFLPATFLATLFSTGFFDWKAAQGSVATISPYIWIYVVVSMVLTVLTLGAWYVYAIRQHKAEGDSMTDLAA